MLDCSHSHGRLLKHICRWVTAPKGWRVARRVVSLSSSKEQSGNTGWDWKRGADIRNAHVCVFACVRVCVCASVRADTSAAGGTKCGGIKCLSHYAHISFSLSILFSPFLFHYFPLSSSLSLSWSVFVSRQGATLAQGYDQVSKET